MNRRVFGVAAALLRWRLYMHWPINPASESRDVFMKEEVHRCLLAPTARWDCCTPNREQAGALIFTLLRTRLTAGLLAEKFALMTHQQKFGMAARTAQFFFSRPTGGIFTQLERCGRAATSSAIGCVSPAQ